MAFPLLNFPVLNPMGNALDRAMGTYRGINEGIAQQLKNQKERQMMPFYLQEADLKNKLNQFKVNQAEAESQYYPEMAKGAYDEQQARIENSRYQAQINKLDAQLRQAKNPYEIQKISAELEQLDRERKLNKKFEEMGIITPQQKKTYGDLQAALMVNQALGQGYGAQSGQLGQPQGQPSEYSPGLTQSMTDHLSPKDNPWAYVSGSNQPGHQFNALEKVAEEYMPSYIVKGKEAQAQATEKGRVGAFNKKMEDLTTKSESANDSNSSLELMAENWNKIPSWNKGRLGGTLPAWEGAGMSYEAAISRMTQQLLSAQKGNQSETDLKEFKKSLPGKTMDDYGFYRTYSYLKALNERALLEQEFFSSQEGRNVNDVQREWNKYVKENSLFDSKAYKEAFQPYQEKLDQKEYEKLQAERRAAGY